MRWVTRWEGCHRGVEKQALLGSMDCFVQVGFKFGDTELQMQLEKQVSKGHVVTGLCGP